MHFESLEHPTEIICYRLKLPACLDCHLLMVPSEAHILPVPKSVMSRKESSLIPTLRSEKALPTFCPDEY